MLDLELIANYTTPVNLNDLFEEEDMTQEQIGKNINTLNLNEIKQDKKFDVALLFINDISGSEFQAGRQQFDNDFTSLRKNFYSLYSWHQQIAMIDFGDLIHFKTLEETYSAIKIITEECNKKNVLLLVLGGPHHFIISQFNGLQKEIPKINFSNIDAFIDLNSFSRFIENNFLDQIFIEQKKYLNHYNHFAFQSYFTHPTILDHLTSIGAEFFRVGYVKENPFEIEPQLRGSHVISFDINAIKNTINKLQPLPNGLSGEDACLMMRFCGMANNLKTMGIYGYYSFLDKNGKMGMQIAQMMWYFIEGIYYQSSEGNFDDGTSYETYFTTFNEIKTIFYQNKKTKRWWVQHLDKKRIIPCSYNDYVLVTKNEIPDRLIKGLA